MNESINQSIKEQQQQHGNCFSASAGARWIANHLLMIVVDVDICNVEAASSNYLTPGGCITRSS